MQQPVEPEAPLPSYADTLGAAPDGPPLVWRRRRSSTWRWLIVLLVLAAAGVAVWQVKFRNPSGGPASAASAAQGTGSRGGAGRFGGANRVQPVSVEAVQRRDIRIMVSAIGTMSASNTATVHPQVSGMLKSINFKEGQQVQAGQLLAQIDARSFEAVLAQAEGTLARDRAQLENARIDATRYRDLFAKDAIAKQQVDTQDALVRQLEGTIQSDQAAVASARLQLSYTRVTAPIQGRVGLKQADLGNVVQPGDGNGIVTITQTRPIALVFAVPSARLPRITTQLRANQALEVQAFSRDGSVRLASGRVASTDNAIDPSTDTIKLKALFNNTDDALVPNQSVTVRLQLDTLVDALAVPQAAVLRGSQGFYVYVVGPDNTVATRVIKPGETDGDWTAVQGPLHAGDRVVIDGADRLREGAQVEVIATDPKLRAGANVPPETAARRRGPRGGASGASGPRGATSGTRGAALGARGAASGARGAGAGSMAGGAAGRAAAGGAAVKGSSAPTHSAQDERPTGDRPRLPPEVLEKLRKMQPEERRAYIAKLREERARRAGSAASAPAN
ncbi:MAG: efflux RND transporter periplasmic adaptor subunit [Burkholderiaceae bacterium]